MSDFLDEKEENLCMRISKKGKEKPIEYFEPELHKALFATSSNH